MNETEIKQKRIEEAAKRSGQSWEVIRTRFLEPQEFLCAQQAAFEYGVSVLLYGGYDDAERKIAAFYPDGMQAEPDEMLTRIELTWNEKYAALSHRDVLGAAMALGIERECLGDILIDKGKAYLFTVNEIAEWITRELVSCGRASVTRRIGSGSFEPPAPEGEIKRITVSSERLDAIIAHTLNISRTKASDLVQSGSVKRKYVEETRPDIRIEAGDVISIRGYGRIRLISWDEETKKGRLAAHVFIYANTKKGT